MRLNKVNQTEPKPLTVTLASGAVIHLSYTRDRYTPALEKKLKKYRTGGDPGTYLAKMVETCVRSWDITVDAPGEEDKPEEDRKQIPLEITAKVLDEQLNIDVQGAIVIAISRDCAPKPETSNDTEDTF